MRPKMDDDRGFSMVLVIMAMLVTAMFVAAGFAAANSDLPMSGASKNRKSAYAAAEAGLNFYRSHLAQNPDYWLMCANVPAPNATENNPVNQVWNGTGSDPRRWRNLPGTSPAQYTIELLPAPANTNPGTCVANDTSSMIDPLTGAFRIRVTGRASSTGTKRSIVASFVHEGFLDYLWFTDFESQDPQAEPTQALRDQRTADCADKYRDDRVGKTCTEISFITGDSMNGPMHSNDSFLYCGAPVWGRTTADKIESSADAPGRYSGGGCSGSPTVNGVFKAQAASMTMPPANDILEDAAVATGNNVYVGKTIIRFNSDGTMTVTYRNPADSTFATTLTKTVPQPANGVIYVKAGGSCTQLAPPVADYAEANTCGNVYVSGQYSQSMTIGAESDIIVKPTLNGSLTSGSSDADLVAASGSDALLGLVANNFVRVAHRCDRSTSPDTNAVSAGEPLVTNVDIKAAMLSLRHSFMVDNYDCGTPLGNLSVTGTIAQKYRGPVGQSSNGASVHGYLKNYTYDDRLRYRSPPYFLTPTKAAWKIRESNEQVPAR